MAAAIHAAIFKIVPPTGPHSVFAARVNKETSRDWSCQFTAPMTTTIARQYTMMNVRDAQNRDLPRSLGSLHSFPQVQIVAAHIKAKHAIGIVFAKPLKPKGAKGVKLSMFSPCTTPAIPNTAIIPTSTTTRNS